MRERATSASEWLQVDGYGERGAGACFGLGATGQAECGGGESVRTGGAMGAGGESCARCGLWAVARVLRIGQGGAEGEGLKGRARAAAARRHARRVRRAHPGRRGRAGGERGSRGRLRAGSGERGGDPGAVLDFQEEMRDARSFAPPEMRSVTVVCGRREIPKAVKPALSTLWTLLEYLVSPPKRGDSRVGDG